MFCARVCTQVAVSQLQDALNDMGVDSTGEGGAGRPRTGKPRQAAVANLGGGRDRRICVNPRGSTQRTPRTVPKGRAVRAPVHI